MKEKLLNFMRGRYGNDQLNICLLFLSVILFIFGGISRIFTSLGYVCFFYALYRSLSRDIYRRRQENARIAPYWSLAVAKIKNRGKARVFMCPKCKRTLRIPKGKGKVSVNCPCGNIIKRKS